MLKKALNQSTPKSLGDIFLTQREKYLLKLAIARMYKGVDMELPEQSIVQEEYRTLARKLGIKF